MFRQRDLEVTPCIQASGFTTHRCHVLVYFKLTKSHMELKLVLSVVMFDNLTDKAKEKHHNSPLLYNLISG